MLSIRLDPDLDRILERDVDDLARYNILRFLHESPDCHEGVTFFADKLGLRSTERVEDALEALVRCGLLGRDNSPDGSEKTYHLNHDPEALELVDRLCALSSTSFYGEIVERLAARSLHRARRSQSAVRGEWR